MTTDALCRACFWAECADVPPGSACEALSCACRCKPRDLVATVDNEGLRQDLAAALRSELYGVIIPTDRGLYFTNEFIRGYLYAAYVVEQGAV